MISIATWNVNSVRARLPNVLNWLAEKKPDIVLLQETKAQDHNFPFEPLEDAGYNIAIHGQKSYNGVAILSKSPIEDIVKTFPGQEEDPQARYIEAVTNGVRVASVYVPNGDTVTSDKYPYKLNFLQNLEIHIAKLLSYDESIVIGGDYNIAPEDDDTSDPEKWAKTVLGTDAVRGSFRRMLNSGYADAYRTLYPVGSVTPAEAATWWDYRSGAWARQTGLRIDHLLLSPQATDRLKECEVHQLTRDKEKASDHAPVVCYLEETSQ